MTAPGIVGFIQHKSAFPDAARYSLTVNGSNGKQTFSLLRVLNQRKMQEGARGSKLNLLVLIVKER